MNRVKARKAAMTALAKIYAQLPQVDCKGLCTESCGPIPRSQLEDEIMAEANGGSLPLAMPEINVGQESSCPLLAAGRCSIYNARPLICRLWGVVDHEFMRCPFGCRPRPRYLTAHEGRVLIERVEEINRRYFEE